MNCKHCGVTIKRHNAKYTNGWTHDGETVGVWCQRTMAAPEEGGEGDE
ncbi:hypothetical protein DFO66_103352 [Brevibacterium sanguinis]|uniref:Uncharacterized protein n=2 Tax=Brevibacterium TaxID=1696 RepID=A0A366IKU9_9MICO|nr:hypothetical protein DFO66_103352 [Brevibacterium sanguinis]RBP73057.1 hypothetical protein DFO65_103352 [Brevibacterium celere]